MDFQISKLIIWPRNKIFPPRIVEFKKDCVNIITGGSRTGKSAIIPIIDYCLASSDCSIPIDTIRDNSEWFGLIAELSDEKILIARKGPTGSSSSNEFYISRGDLISIPTQIPESNENEKGIKHILNTLSGSPYMSLDPENPQNFSQRLSFRDITALLFQSQEIVANQSVLFYKTHAHEHREKLRNWLPYILGAETLETLLARHKLSLINAMLRKLKREFNEAKSVSESWQSNMVGHLRVAKEYGLLDEEIQEETNFDELLFYARNVVNSVPDHTLSRPTDILEASSELSKLEKIDEELSERIGLTKKRIRDINSLKATLTDYSGGVKMRTGRLQVSRWLDDISNSEEACPLCGNSEHRSQKKHIKELVNALRESEDTAKSISKIPTSFDREAETLERELGVLMERKKAYQDRYDVLLTKNKNAHLKFQKRKEMYLFLGHLKASMEVFEKLSDGGAMINQIKELEAERDRIAKIASDYNIKKKVDAATSRISQLALNRLRSLDTDEKYKKVAPLFSIKDLNVSVLSDDGNWHMLPEIGSASNWVSFHIAIICGLQEFFLEQSNSVVPNFAIFDQPSQVYFPSAKSRRTDKEDLKFEDEDIGAVRSMFETLVNSSMKGKAKWQAIVLDHADSDVYGEVDGVYEVEEWREGKKLIPQEWLTTHS